MAALALALAPGNLSAAVKPEIARASCYEPAEAFLSYAVKGITGLGAFTGPRLGQLKADSLNNCELLAKQGDRRAQSFMGLIAHTPDEAFYWMERAAEQGDMPSIERLHTFASTPAEKLKWAMIYRARIGDWPRIRQPAEDPVTPMQTQWATDAVAEASSRLSATEAARIRQDVAGWLRRNPARR